MTSAAVPYSSAPAPDLMDVLGTQFRVGVLYRKRKLKLEPEFHRAELSLTSTHLAHTKPKAGRGWMTCVMKGDHLIGFQVVSALLNWASCQDLVSLANLHSNTVKRIF